MSKLFRAIHEILRNLASSWSKKLGLDLFSEIFWLIIRIEGPVFFAVTSLDITENLLDSILINRLFAIRCAARERQKGLVDIGAAAPKCGLNLCNTTGPAISDDWEKIFLELGLWATVEFE